MRKNDMDKMMKKMQKRKRGKRKKSNVCKMR